MKVQVQIISDDATEIINVEDVTDINNFSYVDSYGANNKMHIFPNGIELTRVSNTHKTNLVLRNDLEAYINIETDEGILKFDVKMLAFERNNDIITLVYSVNEDKRSLIIKY